MITQTELTTMTGPEAYAKAVECAAKAVQFAEANTEHGTQQAQAYAAISQAYAQVAQAEATARGTARPGCYPDGGWRQHTHPNG